MNRHLHCVEHSSHPPTSQNIAPTTRNDSRHWRVSRMKRHFHCAEQHDSPSNFTNYYCSRHEKWLSRPVTYEPLFTLRGATEVILQRHQILRLQRKITLMIAAPHIWNGIYNARSNKSHPPTSPNIAPATKNDSQVWSLSHLNNWIIIYNARSNSSKQSGLTPWSD